MEAFDLFILFLFVYLFSTAKALLTFTVTLSGNKSLQFFFLKQKIQGEF